MAAPADNVTTATEFLRLSFEEHEPEEAVARYVGDRYIQHNPRVPDGKDGFIAMAKSFASLPFDMAAPDRKVTVATEEYVVFLQHLAKPGTPGTALVDIFRFDPDGRIVEHWDVAQDVPEADQFAHTNGMF